MTNDKKIKIFLDTIGRTIIGEVSKETEKALFIKNPAVVNITPNPQNGQISLQLLPLFFREFLADINESTQWSYQKSMITTCEDVTLDFKFIAQYQQIFQPSKAQATEEQGTVKLFDE